MANTSSVCGRSAALDEPAQHDHVDYFQSFAKFYESGLPSKLPAREEAVISQYPQLLDLESKVHQLKSGQGSPSQIQAAVSKARACRLRLTRKRLQQYKLEWVRERRDWKVITRGKGRAEEQSQTDLSDILAQVMPERGRLAKTMISAQVVSEKERKDAIKDLCSLASLDCTTIYRPGEEPAQGSCPIKSCSLAVHRYFSLRSNNCARSNNNNSLPKVQRSTHIHHCRQRELAKTLERMPSELQYCFTCFDWYVEEEWDQHCQKHLESITSKRCASITYCNTLVRPAFCPFCLGGKQLPASNRWSSWTREAKLWGHLGEHLATACWPRKCPHPLCSLDLESEKSFIYHLNDVHGLQMSASMQKSWPSKRDCEALTWAPGAGSQKGKRKRQGGDEQELRSSNKCSKPITLVDEKDPKPPGHLFDPKVTDVSQTSLPLETPKASLMDWTADDDMLPKLSHDISSLSPDTNEIHSLHSFSQQENILPVNLIDEPELDQDKVQILADDALFSEFLRSPSPPLCHIGADNGKEDLQISISPQTIVPANVCFFPERDPRLVALVTEPVPDVKDQNIQTKRPCVTLHVRPTNTAFKRKVSLRLNPPKRAPKPKSIRRGPKNRSSKRV